MEGEWPSYSEGALPPDEWSLEREQDVDEFCGVLQVNTLFGAAEGFSS